MLVSENHGNSREILPLDLVALPKLISLPLESTGGIRTRGKKSSWNGPVGSCPGIANSVLALRLKVFVIDDQLVVCRSSEWLPEAYALLPSTGRTLP